MSNIFTDEQFYKTVEKLAADDAHVLKERDKSYGSSWKKRGGMGAFMMLARKWDRIEHTVKSWNWDVFVALEQDSSDTGIIDDIRDLRRYLLLVEAEMTLRGTFSNERFATGLMKYKISEKYEKDVQAIRDRYEEDFAHAKINQPNERGGSWA